MLGPTQLGEFILESELARGSMGQVWSARHAIQGTPAAIKFIVDPQSELPAKRDALRAEVQAVAALDHPNITRLFDYGSVPPAIAARYPALLERTPYLVMEYAPHGAFHSWIEGVSFTDLCVVLRHVLDGLAHAHARGIVHCDLKPENILLFGPSDDIICKLTDFGIAHAFRDEVGEGEVRGTPAYMAPEQFTEPADRGPWTDLYALGIIAWEGVCRRLPFTQSDPNQLASAHVHSPRPALRPQFPVPDGFAGWVDRLMARDWRRRFPSAADARWALDQIVPAGGRLAGEAEPEDSMADTLQDVDTGTVRIKGRALPVLETPAPRPQAIPCPETWRLGRQESPRERLLGVGLALYGLRAVPFVGRDAELDKLWGQLRGVHQRGTTRGVILRGTTGAGKSRLSQWFTERAHEVGSAEVLDVRHSRVANANSGLDGMLARWLRPTGDLERDSARVQRLRGLPGAPDFWSQALAALANPALAPDPFQSAAQRHFALMDLLVDAHGGRPFLIRVDDAQWGLDALDFVIELLKRQRAPALILVNVREDAVAEGSPVEARLSHLSQLDTVSTLPVEPLSEDAHRRFIEQLLPLDSELVDQVAARTQGNPLFAVQLVGDWVDRGVLRSGPFGFELPTHEMPVLPTTIHQLCIDRLDDAIGPLDAQHTLEIAAALGGDIDFEEWRAACATAGLQANATLIHDLARRGIVHAEPDRWRFAHAMVRESLERVAKEERRWTNHHRACAIALQESGSQRIGNAERVADHWLAADEAERALPDLLRAARVHIDHTARTRAAIALDKAEAALSTLGADPEDPRRVECLAIRVFYAISGGDGQTAVRHMAHVEASAARLGLTRIQAEMVRVRGILSRAEGRLGDAGAELQQAAQLAERAGDWLMAGKACLGQVDIFHSAGDLDGVQRAIELAMEHFQAADSTLWLTTARVELGRLAFERGDLEEARRIARQVQNEAPQHGDLVNQGRASDNLGAVEWFAGNLQAARAGFEQARQIYERLDNINRHVSWGKMALVELAAGDLTQAGEYAEWCRQALAGTPWPDGMPALPYVQLAVACAHGDRASAEALTHKLTVGGTADEGLRMVAYAAELTWPHVARFDLDVGAAIRDRAIQLYSALGDLAGVARLTPS